MKLKNKNCKAQIELQFHFLDIIVPVRIFLKIILNHVLIVHVKILKICFNISTSFFFFHKPDPNRGLGEEKEQSLHHDSWFT